MVLQPVSGLFSKPSRILRLLILTWFGGSEWSFPACVGFGENWLPSEENSWEGFSLSRGMLSQSVSPEKQWIGSERVGAGQSMLWNQKQKETKRALEKFIKSTGTLVKAQPISRNSGREGSEVTASAVQAWAHTHTRSPMYISFILKT